MYITVDEANAYADKNKLIVTAVDVDLETSQAVQLFAKLGQVYDVSTWVDDTTTPSLVRKVLAMYYTGWFYLRTYSEDEDVSTYGQMLIRQADDLLAGIVAGTLVLSDVSVPAINPDQPSFYPDDASSALTPTASDRSLGDAKFSMGTIW
jgi:hypothetical protein